MLQFLVSICTLQNRKMPLFVSTKLYILNEKFQLVSTYPLCGDTLLFTIPYFTSLVGDHPKMVAIALDSFFLKMLYASASSSKYYSTFLGIEKFLFHFIIDAFQKYLLKEPFL